MSVLGPAGPRKWQQLQWDRGAAARLALELDLSPAIAAMLLQRGHTDPDAIERFLYPKLRDLPSPFLLQGMQKGVELVHEACMLRQPVLVYGDYDVDGTTGAAVLGVFLKRLGLRVYFCQPNRLADGYGLKTHLLEAAHGEHFQGEAPRSGLLITVDCGITDHHPIIRARELGFKVLVTDHHQPPPTPVPAHCIINPWQKECSFPFKHLAGVGVAFYLIMGVRSHLAKAGYWAEGASPNLREYLDLVALGTVADMVPLVGVNRILVKAGLVELEKTGRPGIRAMLEHTGMHGRRLGAEDIGFRLGPRLNAAGRMGDPGRALSLLLTEDGKEGERLASELEVENGRRKETENELLRETLSKINDDGVLGPAVVLSGDGWHAGILGIVAARLMHTFFRPVILLSQEEGLARGSARSIPGIDLFGALQRCSGILESFGGHASAAGMSIKTSNIQEFIDKFSEVISDVSTLDMFTPKLAIDWVFDETAQLDTKFVSDYFLLGPFGQGNSRPVLAGLTGQCMHNLRIVGNNHLRFQWPGAKPNMSGIGFRFGQHRDRLACENGLLAFTLQRNVFQGQERAEMQVEDIFFNNEAAPS